MAAVIQIPYLNQLPSDYKKAVKALNRKLTKSKDLSEKLRHLKTFTDKYTAIPEIWDYYLRINNPGNPVYMNNNIHLKRTKIFPHYSLKEWPSYPYQPHFLTATANNSAKLSKASQDATDLYLFVPHSKLSAALERYIEISPTPLSQEASEKYKAACKLYQELKDCDINDGKKYMDLLKITMNNEFIVTNTEIRLYKYPWNQSLWTAYIEYLSENKSRDKKALLHVLQRYCRLFFTDKEMKEKYRSIIKELSQNSVDEMIEFWIDSIKFEFDFQNVEDGKTLVEDFVSNYAHKMSNLNAIFDAIKIYAERYDLKDVLTKPESCFKDMLISPRKPLECLTFDTKTKVQKLPFSGAVNRYLYDSADHQHLQKLYQTCKWFYYKYRYNLVHRLKTYSTDSDDKKSNKYFYHNSASVKIGKAQEMPLKMLWLTHSLELYKIIQPLTQKIARNSLKYLDLGILRMSFNEFKFLASSKELIKIKIGTTIVDCKGVDVPIEDIFVEIPQIRQFICDRCIISAVTSEKLLLIKFKNKLEKFQIFLTQIINVNNFFIFLQINLAPNAIYYTIAHDHLQLGHDQIFQRNLKQLLEAWTPVSEKPIMEYSF